MSSARWMPDDWLAYNEGSLDYAVKMGSMSMVKRHLGGIL